jgi:excisionase family DNA binding protein
MREAVYTPEEIAGLLKVSAYTVRRWLKAGDLAGVKVRGFMWRVKASALEEFLHARMNGKEATR